MHTVVEQSAEQIQKKQSHATYSVGAGSLGTLRVAVRYTLVTAVLLGLVYPAVVTGIAQLTMRDKANGQLVVRHGVVIGSAIIGQNFTNERYFRGRPSAAGNGYDAANSGGSNLAQSNQALVDRINGLAGDYLKQDANELVPVELVTTSASGLDPDISAAAAEYQVRSVARARHASVDEIRTLVRAHTSPRQFGVLGEPRVNVLQLNLDLDQHFGG